MARLKISAALMCAGLSTRFHSNKLLYNFLGEPLIARFSRTFPKDAFNRVIAVVSNLEIKKLLEGLGYETVWNPRPEEGQNSTIRIAVPYIYETDACMFCVCDQPFLSPHTIRKMALNYKSGAMTLSYNYKISSPMIIPHECYNALATLSPGKRGRDALKTSEIKPILYSAECAIELIDTDTTEIMDKLLKTKNIFLIGPQNIGKSTLLFEALYEAGAPTTGFLTLPYGDKNDSSGYFFHGFNDTLKHEENDKPISFFENCVCKPVTETFETAAVKCLNAATEQNKFIIMDELGILENDANNFKTLVYHILDSNQPVFGILKDADSPFLNGIKNRSDTRVIRVRERGDAYAFEEIKKHAGYLKQKLLHKS